MKRLTQALFVSAIAATAVFGQISITTQFAQNNSQSGNMFDVVSLDGINIVGMDVNLLAGTWDLELYATTDGGPLDAVRTNPNAWTLVASASDVVSNGPDVPTPFPTAFEIEVAKGSTRGIYITCTDGAGMHYTSVPGPVGNVIVDDGNLQILDGYGVVYPFGGFFSPRRWNGTLRYWDTLDVPTDVPTIQGAINIADSQQKVRVASGVHVEHDIDFNGRPVTVTGEVGAVVDAAAQGRVFLFDSAEGADSILENLTLQGGITPPTGVNGGSGGGIFISGSSPTLRNLTIQNCVSRSGLVGPAGGPPLGGGVGGNGGDGGAIHIENGSPLIEDCNIFGCATGDGGSGGVGLFGGTTGNGGAGGRGGAVSVVSALPTFVRCRFEDCRTGIGGSGTFGGRGGDGGAVFVDLGASAFFLGCRLFDNTAGDGSGFGVAAGLGGFGGGFYIAGNAIIQSTVVADNQAGAGASGGGIFLHPTAVCDIEHATIADNVAGAPIPGGVPSGADGGGVAANAPLTIENSILWFNELADGTPDQVSGAPTILASDVEGGYPGAGNVDVAPSFRSRFSDDYSLFGSSQLIDAGDASLTSTSRDADLETRIVGFQVDMGAFEIRPASLRGTEEDFDLEVTVNESGASMISKVALPGDRMVARMFSNNGTFDFRPVILLGQVFPTSAPVGTVPTFPILHIPAGFILFNGLAPTPFSDGLLPPGGMSFAWIVPPPLTGFTGRLQAIAVAGFAANGILATSDAPEVVFE